MRDYAIKQRNLATLFFDKNTELNAFESLSETVEKGTKFEVKIPVRAGCELVYEWILEDHDIYFSVLAPDGSPLVAPASHACNVKNETPYQGRLTAATTGDYSLVWDNSGSWFTAKTVNYHQVAVDPEDPVPWTKWPTLAEARAAE